ncbi:MAG: hypothetical protein JNK87_38360 [Bryobacterales bacterium]|nr:hypothetical protein [Bryobacterales bacterium]
MALFTGGVALLALFRHSRDRK